MAGRGRFYSDELVEVESRFLRQRSSIYERSLEWIADQFASSRKRRLFPLTNENASIRGFATFLPIVLVGLTLW